MYCFSSKGGGGGARSTGSHQAHKPKLPIPDNDLFPGAQVGQETPCCVLESAGDNVKARPEVCA